MEARDAEPIVRPPETVGLDAGAMDGRELILSVCRRVKKSTEALFSRREIGINVI